MNFNFNEFSINLGEPHVDDSKFKMENDTSYLQKFVKMYKTSKQYRETLLPLKLQCLFNIKEYLGDNYDSYFEPLAGLGITAKIFGVDATILSDHSEECVSILDNNFPDYNVYNLDMFHLGGFIVDFIFLDFNNFTLKKYLELYKPIVDQTFENSKKYVLINDCSRFYLKYGKASYESYSKLLGFEVTNMDEFYIGLTSFYKKHYPEWGLSRIEAFKDTSFLLFEKGEQVELNINVNTKEDITVKTSISE